MMTACSKRHASTGPGSSAARARSLCHTRWHTCDGEVSSDDSANLSLTLVNRTDARYLLLALVACHRTEPTAAGPSPAQDAASLALARDAGPDVAAVPPSSLPAPDDLSTDAAALAAYERLAPALGIYPSDPSGAHAGGCVTRPAQFPGLVLVARAVQDLGCYGQGAFFGGRLYANVGARTTRASRGTPAWRSTRPPWRRSRMAACA